MNVYHVWMRKLPDGDGSRYLQMEAPDAEIALAHFEHETDREINYNDVEVGPAPLWADAEKHNPNSIRVLTFLSPEDFQKRKEEEKLPF